AGIVRRAVEMMRSEFGAEPYDLRAASGPAALACCYEVGADVIGAFGEGAAQLFTPTRDGHALVDLHRANCDQLFAAGLNPARIHTAPLCTISRPDLFFSYRREKRLAGRVGRLLSVIGRR
ncbi:MAG TPA: laccase domain-containing protein, partial [Pyrinomonadaceae bacterium]|nr:laccase domain-containing protein [Pyrinomonadaceae bacterium]